MTSTSNADASLVLAIAGLPVGKPITIEIYEVDPPTASRSQQRQQTSGDVLLGNIAGTVTESALATSLTGVPTIVLKPDAPPPKPPDKGPLIEIFVPGFGAVYRFAIPPEVSDLDEGDYWELQARIKDPAVSSPIVTVAHIRRSLEPALANYRWHEGHTLKPYSDGATDIQGAQGAFADMMVAIDQAQALVLVVDWSFHPFFLPNLASHDLTGTIGARLLRKAAAGVTVAIHTWDHTNIAAKDTQNDDGEDWLAALLPYAGVPVRPPNFRWRSSSPSGISYSHHQKFVLVDEPSPDGRRQLHVFFGGLDLTKGRLDWQSHPTSAGNKTLVPRRQGWGTSPRLLTNEWYNAETDNDLDLPRQPWHDIYGNVTGPATWDFLREFVTRWAANPGSHGGDMLDKKDDPVCAVWTALQDKTKWVQQYEPHDGPWAAQLVRSNTRERCAVPEQIPRPASDALFWRVPTASEASILNMYRQGIDLADRFIYIENQYLIGGGDRWTEDRKSVANDIPERIVNRILAKQGQDFHVYVVTPMFPEGDPVSTGGIEIRNYEWRTLEYMIKALQAALGKQWQRYISFFFLANWDPLAQRDWKGGDRHARLLAHQRYMVYVHSKMMIVDDRFMIFGSANLNERSLAGDRDTEIACAFWPGRNQEAKCTGDLRDFRKQLWEEHFGPGLSGADDPAGDACIEACQRIGDANYLAFRTMSPGQSGHACRLPMALDKKGRIMLGKPDSDQTTPEGFLFLPDGEPKDSLWTWTCRGSRLPLGKAAE